MTKDRDQQRRTAGEMGTQYGREAAKGSEEDTTEGQRQIPLSLGTEKKLGFKSTTSI